MREFLEKILNMQSLSVDESEQLLNRIMDGEGDQVQIGAILAGLRAKGESVEEILGFVRALRSKSRTVRTLPRPLMDTCGTGGDGSSSFNISTLVAFVLAGAGVRVAKHGNRAVSGQTGSADLVEALGIRVEWKEEEVEEGLCTTSFAFLFAPYYHPAMKVVAPIRKALGVKTVFNLLGPMTNPCIPEYQLIGVYSLARAQMMAEVLSHDKRKKVFLIHSDLGWDEAVPAVPCHLFRVEGDQVKKDYLQPEELGFAGCRPEDLQGGTSKENAAAALRVLRGENGALREAVVLNAGLAFLACEKVGSLHEGFELAREILDSGKAHSLVETLREKFPQ